jgi:hypothetical protein
MLLRILLQTPTTKTTRLAEQGFNIVIAGIRHPITNSSDHSGDSSRDTINSGVNVTKSLLNNLKVMSADSLHTLTQFWKRNRRSLPFLDGEEGEERVKHTLREGDRHRHTTGVSREDAIFKRFRHNDPD